MNYNKLINTFKGAVLYILLSILFSLSTQAKERNVAIIPMPNAMQILSGGFMLNEKTTLHLELPSEQLKVLRKQISFSGLPVMKEARKKKNTVRFELSDTAKWGTEGYRLEVSNNAISIHSSTSAGLYYALQTLTQLYEQNPHIPAMIVEDTPRFGYRGLHLDVSRHFLNKDFVIKQIDAIARYKINRLHLHLTDGAGWRIEIKKYPKLTEYAAWRPFETWKEWRDNGYKYGSGDNGLKFGGYYTQEEIKEIVAYAADRNITVIPEIEMPGHSDEVVAAYPELGCTCVQHKLYDFCLGTEKTFSFLEDVLTEVIDLFPSEYIHIGGDEAVKYPWNDCDRCKKRMKDEGLKDVDELQSYCIRRIEQFLNKKGRKLLGWEEILAGGLAPNATVMTWTNEDGAIKAAKLGHHAVMTPSAYCYFDNYQDAPMTQPEAVGGMLPLKKVYSYNPVPSVLTAQESQYILGVQGNIWTEYIPTPEYVEYMIYPRMLAIAENGWTTPEVKCWELFHREALRQVAWLQQHGYHPFDLSKEVGDRPAFNVSANHLALDKKVVYNQPYSPFYIASGDKTLVDGAKGNWMYTDGRWQGFANCALDVTIDLKTVTDIHHISGEFMQFKRAGIYFPGSIDISFSDDGINYRKVEKATYDVDSQASELLYRTLEWKGKEKARYIRYVAQPSSTAHEWIFIDEIEVK